jgi:hypothetical protein
MSWLTRAVLGYLIVDSTSELLLGAGFCDYAL